jgi:hypothetical protein
MATYRKTHFVGIIVSAVMIAFLIIFLLKQYVLTINIKDKGPSTMNVINPQLNDSFYDSYSGSGLAFGSASGRDSNFHLRSRNVMSLDSSSNSNSGSNSITSSSTNSPKASDKQTINKQKMSWLYRQPQSDESHIVEGEYELCTGDVFGMAVNWVRINKFCHHVIDNDMVNSYFEASNGVTFKHCRALEYKVESQSEHRPCWPNFYTSGDTWNEYIWTNTAVGDWIQDAIGITDVPFTSYGLQCYVRKSLDMSKDDMKEWYDSQSGCGDSLVGFMLQES